MCHLFMLFVHALATIARLLGPGGIRSVSAEIEEIKKVAYLPLSHPFIERLIGTVRREFLNRTLFWTSADLENKRL